MRLPSLLHLTLAFSLLLAASLTPLPARNLEMTGAMREETRKLVKYLENVHYQGKPISELDTQEFIKTYMGDLDHQHLFFLEKDRLDFNLRFADSMTLYLRQGTLMPAFEVFKVYDVRARERLAWIFNRIEQPFAFDTEEKFAPDRSETGWPVSEADADRLWNHRLKYEILNEILSGEVSDQDKLRKQEEEAVEAKETAESEPAEAETAEAETVAKSEGGETEEAEAEEPFTPRTYEELLSDARDTVRQRYEQLERNVNQLEGPEVQEIFLTALTHMYDPHSTYLSADTLEDFTIAMKNSLVGIGAMLSTENGYCTIKELIPGGPADTSNKFAPEDKIVGVAQGEDGEMVDVIGMKLRKIVKRIRGKKGTIVRLLIQPADGDPGQRKVISLVRDKIKLTATLAQAEIFEVPGSKQTWPIGVINLPAFYGSGAPGNKASSTTTDVAELINKLKGAGIKGLVLDLRNNGGGLLSEAVSLAGLFIPQGPVVQVRNTIGHIDEHRDDDPNVAWNGPLIVLVSRFSASASEIVTGALSNHKRALIVGDKNTHGKGTVQAVFEMDRSGIFRPARPKSGAAKVTIQKWYLPNGNSTQIKGVASDITLPSLNEFLPIGEDDLPRAMVWDAIQPLASFQQDAFLHDVDLSRHLISDNLVDELKTLSEGRQSELDEFAFLRENIDVFRKKNDEKELSLNLNERRKKLETDREFRDQMEDKREVLASKDEFNSEEILLDITLEKQEESRLAHAEDEKIEEEEEDTNFDIHLRESLRIMVDWLNLQASAPESAPAQKESKDEPEAVTASAPQHEV